jgi:hypothetical protein
MPINGDRDEYSSVKKFKEGFLWEFTSSTTLRMERKLRK